VQPGGAGRRPGPVGRRPRRSRLCRRHRAVDIGSCTVHRLIMTTQQRLDRLEEALTNLATIIEAEGRWSASANPTVRVFGATFNEFATTVARERAAKS
jgi:hypothetical protein